MTRLGYNKLMFAVFLSLGFIFVLLLVSNWVWQRKKLQPERARKFIHIVVGSFIASWPFFMSFETIRWLSILMLAVVVVSKYRNIFPAVHSVRRETWGEVLFPLGIGIAAFLTDSPWVFASAVLHMSVADGLAAVTGVTWGRQSEYRVLGQTKSVVGSLSFFLCSLIITAVASQQGGINYTQLTLPLLMMLPFAATVAENFSPYGADNLSVPVLVVFFMTYAQLLS